MPRTQEEYIDSLTKEVANINKRIKNIDENIDTLQQIVSQHVTNVMASNKAVATVAMAKVSIKEAKIMCEALPFVADILRKNRVKDINKVKELLGYFETA